MSSCPHGRVFLLQNEVTLLRNEVAQLKQLLLAHKDCPVTALQKKTQGYLGEWCLLLLLLLLLSGGSTTGGHKRGEPLPQALPHHPLTAVSMVQPHRGLFGPHPCTGGRCTHAAALGSTQSNPCL